MIERSVSSRHKLGLVFALCVLSACGGGGGGGQPATITPTGTGVPAAPTSVAAVGLSGSRIDLSWDDVADIAPIEGYQVLRNGVAVSYAGSTQFSDTGLVAATQYQYTVKACRSRSVCSAESALTLATTTAVLPDVDVTTTAATPEVNVGLGTGTSDGAGVSYSGPALRFGPVTLSGFQGPVSLSATGPLAGFMQIKINQQPVVPGTTAVVGDVLTVDVDMAAYAADLQTRTGSALDFNTLYTPQVNVGATVITLGTTPAGPGVLTCSNPTLPPVLANTPCS